MRTMNGMLEGTIYTMYSRMARYIPRAQSFIFSKRGEKEYSLHKPCLTLLIVLVRKNTHNENVQLSIPSG